ncbi:uncharacterized protein [Venturia canescens]|uniref:uncharacterized protein n=1 Tax=Venturia canescens TaxID=32260 RepID=UPI001C9CF8C0|nr:uncharacterized protein LOC122410733 [Venturia canescens]
MWIRHTFITAIIGVALTKSQSFFQPLEPTTKMLFDFTNVTNVDDWMEISDTVREVGMSKAVLTLQKTRVFQRAIFFTLLNPQPNGAGFAGVRTRTNLDLTGYKYIEMLCRAQGANQNYKIVLRHRGMAADSDVEYEHFFSVSTSNGGFETVKVTLADFKPYFRGREQPDEPPLDVANITMFGIQVYGGVYLPIKQKGVSSLEIKTITATNY